MATAPTTPQGRARPQQLDAHLTGEFATSSLDVALGGSACELAAVFGSSCVPCASSVGDCIVLESDGVAAEVVGLNLVERTQQMIDADPGC